MVESKAYGTVYVLERKSINKNMLPDLSGKHICFIRNIDFLLYFQGLLIKTSTAVPLYSDACFY